MTLPKKLKIGGFDWVIIYNHDVNHESSSWGSTHFQTQRIFIEEGLSEQKTSEVLIHEILHVLIGQSGYRVNLNGEQDEERLIQALDHGLYQVLKENKLEFYDGKV